MTRWHLAQGVKYALSLLPPALIEPYGVRHRSRLIRQAEGWSADRMTAYQLSRLNYLLAWAVQHVPFYRKRDLAAALPLRALDDLRAWPVVDRSMMSQRLFEFRSRGFAPWRWRAGSTTGRSGRPLPVRWEWPSAVWWERAFHDRVYRWAGLRPGFRRVVLRGGLVHGPDGVESRFWQVVPHARTLVLSVYQLERATVNLYVETMERFHPDALQAYPSAAVRLSRLLTDCDLSPPRFKAVLTSSEMLQRDDRLRIERCFGAPVVDLYGHAERAVAAAQCEYLQGHHLFEDYGYAEILDTEGMPVPDGSVGEIVATGFHNRVMPFIRYRTGDFASVATEPCPCGRPSRIIGALEGRSADGILTEHGEEISLRLGLGGADLEGIEELRFIQESPGVVDVQYVGRDDPAVAARLSAALRVRTGQKIRCTVHRVFQLPPGPGGKAVLVDRTRMIP